MIVTAIIPARLASTRLKNKLLQDLAGKPLIIRVWEAAHKTELFDKIIVATDSAEIYQLIEENGGNAFLSQKDHQSGTDRIEEAAAEIESDIIINIQGDEPFLDKVSLENLIKEFDDKDVEVASLMHKISLKEEINNPNNVKVVVDNAQNAIYFSRSPIPYNRDNYNAIEYFKHIGIYAFRKNLLKTFVRLPMGFLESIEKLEQLRLIENSIKIKMVLTDSSPIGIDTIEDLENARKIFERKLNGTN